jgi:hypothetical protein
MERSAVLSERVVIDTFKRIVDANRIFVLTTDINPEGHFLGSELPSVSSVFSHTYPFLGMG